MPGYRNIGRLITIFISLLLAGCAGSPSTLMPASTNARVIANLMWFFFGIAILTFLIVEGLLIYSSLKFRRKGPVDLHKEGLPDQNEGNQKWEIAWTVAPAVVLAVIFIISAVVLWAVVSQPDLSANVNNDPSAVNIRVIAHQWWWEFRYPDQQIVTANEYHVPINTVVNLTVESADVIHSYWAPQLGGKIDVIPGHLNQTWFNVTESGRYQGECAEYCGTEHAKMRFIVEAETAEQFQAWVKQQQSPPVQMTGDAAAGEQIFMSGVCGTCHAVQGTKAKGMVGPDLTHFASRMTFAGSSLDISPQNLSAWLADPSKLKSGAKMPNLGLSPDKISALVSYLENLK
jgi:cytochrome c oxidase subunit II